MSVIQKIFQDHFLTFMENHNVSIQQGKAALQIMQCKTKAYGGQSYSCDHCNYTVMRHRSCRNRHCPTCQGINKEIWVDKRRKDILNAPYFHVVFTMPKQIQRIIYHNQKLLYNLMYKAVAETLTELSADKKYLGAQIGFFSLLHTWGQNLHYHPHIHTVVLAGGLTEQDQWKSTGQKFFIPVKVLSKKFRGKFLYYLKRYYQKGNLKFYKDLVKYKEPKQFRKLIDECYDIDWYSYTKRTFGSPLAVMKYLGRYTHRVAISNQRVLSVGKNTVTIGVKDYKDNNKKKQVTLKTTEFIRRFLMHILPRGFVKIRHYGLLANRNRKTKLQTCRRLTRSPTYKSQFEGLNNTQIASKLLGKDVTLCPACKESQLKPDEDDTS